MVYARQFDIEEKGFNKERKDNTISDELRVEIRKDNEFITVHENRDVFELFAMTKRHRTLLPPTPSTPPETCCSTTIVVVIFIISPW